MLKRRTLLILLILPSLFLAGCGYRGPLYLPQEAPQNQPEETPPATPTDTTPGDRD